MHKPTSHLPTRRAVELLRQRLLATCTATPRAGAEVGYGGGSGGMSGLREALVLAHDCALLGHSGRCAGGSGTGAPGRHGADHSVVATGGRTGVGGAVSAGALDPTTFTAVGAFHLPSDHVLLLDVFRPNPVTERRAGPVWVPLRALVEAMRCPPGNEHYCHGYLRLRRRASSPILLFHQLLLGDAALALATRHRGGKVPAAVTLHGQGDCHDGACAANASVGMFAFCDESAGAAGAATVDSVAAPPAPCFQRRRYGMAAHWSHSWRSGMGQEPSGWSVDGLLTRPAAVETIVASFLSQLPDWDEARTRRAAAAALAPPVAKCIDKLSQQHIAETSALLMRLESTRAYPLVFAALQRQLALRGAHNVIAEAATGEAIASGLTSEFSSGGSSSSSGLWSGYLPGEGHKRTAGANAGARGADAGSTSVASLLASLEDNNCAGCGVSCVRINIAHVITVRADCLIPTHPSTHPLPGVCRRAAVRDRHAGRAPRLVGRPCGWCGGGRLRARWLRGGTRACINRCRLVDRRGGAGRRPMARGGQRGDGHARCRGRRGSPGRR